MRADKGWGEVAWDTEITNQSGETVASYDVLTMVSVHEVPDRARLEANRRRSARRSRSSRPLGMDRAALDALQLERLRASMRHAYAQQCMLSR